MEERTVAGSPKDVLHVRHLKLKGSNEQIGQELGRIARDRHGTKLAEPENQVLLRARKKYYSQNYPTHFDRMKGAAKAFGVDPQGTRDNCELDFNLEISAACSTVYYPPASTVEGHGILSRNYDFSTTSLPEMLQLPAPPNARAMTGDPYVIEIYPDRGHASLYVCAYDLLGGCIDGINSEGLTVALLADDDSNSRYQLEPTRGSQVGLNEIQITRFLLDTCSCVEDAKEALYIAKQYYSFILCHYIVADRHGNSFVWEYSHAHNKEYVIDGSGPQVVTNHPLHKPAQVEGNSIERFCKLNVAVSGKKLSMKDILDANCSVAVAYPDGSPGGKPHRTLWHSVYNTHDSTAEMDFYLSEDREHPSGQKRSGYVKFWLE